jgi:HJR/Mrr/RecB family endonuclease
VQEAVGARLHYHAQIMVVVAPNGFTRSAVELARSNGVHLLHHSEIATLEARSRIPH